MKRLILSLFVLTTFAFATIINVPADQMTIQAGIGAASNGDTVLVAAGTYTENIDFNGKDIMVGSLYLTTNDTSYISSTIIDGNQSGSVVTFDNGEDSSSILNGFTITNGYGDEMSAGGGGIQCRNGSSPILTNLIISNNSNAGKGGGIFCRQSNPNLSYVTIRNNSAVKGGGIYAESNSSVSFENVTISGNTAIDVGGGIYISYSSISIENMTIIGNTATGGGGGIYFSSQSVSFDRINIENAILWANYPQQIMFTGGADDTLSINYSNIQGGENELDNIQNPDSGDYILLEWGIGNIDANPLFCEPDSGDYTLAENSPCVGTGENGANMGAFGVGCDSLILAPVILDIAFDQQIYEDDSLTIVVSATSDINASMTFNATSDTSDVSVTMDSTTLTATPAQDWNGSSLITVIVIDENGLSDTTDFTLTVNAVNDSPEEFSVIYPTVSDTFSTHVDNDTLIQFTWGKSNDIDSDITYNLTIELEFFGNTYTDIHENISDTIISVSSNSLDPMLNVVAQDESGFTYYVHASDDEYTVVSDIGEFVSSRAALGSVDGYAIPEQFSLHQNYPNPFNPVTTLRYDLPENGIVTITIYDMLGRQVKTLINQTQDAGFKSVIWDATNDYGKPVSAGIYLYQIQAGEYMQTKKMVLLK